MAVTGDGKGDTKATASRTAKVIVEMMGDSGSDR